MADSGGRSSATARRKSPTLRRAWCCSFSAAPPSPDCRSNAATVARRRPSKSRHHTTTIKPAIAGSFHSSPSPTSKLGLGIIDPRRILSPGRVSPIDSDTGALDPLPELAPAEVAVEPESPDPAVAMDRFVSSEPPDVKEARSSLLGERGLDLRLCLKGKDGRCLVVELDSRVLCESSEYFAALVVDSCRGGSDDVNGGFRKIEVAGVDNMDLFRETIELMYEKDAARWLMRVGVSRAIDILEVSSSIMFESGIRACLKYIDAVPWSESEEDKLKSLFARCAIDENLCQDVLARLGPKVWGNSGNLAIRLIESVAAGTNMNSRKELRSLVNGLLSKSSVYQKDPAGLSKESLYRICHSCLYSLGKLFEEASASVLMDQVAATKEMKPLIERVSKQVENLNWLLEILIDKEMAEEFVDLWANQEKLVGMHAKASPMVKYELSRISASVFIALGGRKLQCNGEIRLAILQVWFRPMLMDFGWLRRCPKGLDMKMLEESLGQVILTLPLKQQQSFFEEWFRCFAAHGTECPNLTKSFQVCWRRSFVRLGGQR